MKKGFTLIETVIAISLLATFSFLIIYFLIDTEVAALKNYKNYLALNEAKEYAQAVISIKKKSFQNLTAGQYILSFSQSTQQWNLVNFTDQQNDPFFISEILISDETNTLKKVAINVYSKDNYQIRQTTQSLTFYLANYENNVTSQLLPSLNFSANPLGITNQGQPLVLSWSSVNTSACVAYGDWSGYKPISGSQTVYPLSRGYSIYNLTCSGSGVDITKSVSVNAVSDRLFQFHCFGLDCKGFISPHLPPVLP